MTTVLDSDTVRAALEIAVRAPSIHNSQPWRFRVGPRSIQLHADPTRQLDATDPDGRDLLLSCGAVLHHLRVALSAFGWLAVTDRLPDPDRPEHLATIEAVPRVSRHTDLALAVSIPRRRSDRRAYSPRPVPGDCLAELTRAAAAEATVLRVVPSGPARTTVVSAIADADVVDLTRWTVQRSDGVPDAGTLLVLGTVTDDRVSRLRAGEATSAVLLAATRMGLATCPLTQPLEIPTTREQLHTTTLHAELIPQLLLRVGWPPETANPFPLTRRRPTSDVMEP